MGRAAPIVTSLTGGEFSPLIEGRTDLQKYRTGCRTMENCRPLPQGPAQMRGGFHFVKEVKDSTKKVRMVEFEFSTTQAYILEMGDQYIRFYRNKGRIQATAVITNATDNGGGLIRIENVGHGFVTSDTIFIANILGTTEANGAWTITRIDADNYDLQGSAFSNAFVASPDSEAVAETATPYLEADLFEIQFAQSADTLYIAHRDYAPRTLTRTTHTSWTLAKISFTGTTFPSTFCGGAAGVGTDGNSNNPGAVTFHEQRLGWGGTINQPQRWWLSETGDFVGMDLGTGADDEAIEYTLGSDQVNNIIWMRSARSLLIGTRGGEWNISGNGNAITPSNAIARRDSTHGSKEIEPVMVGNVLLFAQKSGRKLREMVFNFDTDGFVAPDLTLLAEHITESGMNELAYQGEPYPTVWAPRVDGTLAGLTYMREENVVGWHRDTTGANGLFESAASIPSSDDSTDELWCVIKRTVNGATKRYVEYQDPAIFVDSGLTYSGAATTTLSGLDHLIGETVKVVGNGALFPDAVVDSSGQITLSKSVTTAYVGLGYVGKIIPVRPDTGNPAGTGMAKKKRQAEILVLFHETQGASINGTQLPFRKASDPMDTPVPAFSGWKRISNLGYDRDGFVTIEQTLPFPMTVLAIVSTLNVNDN